MIDLSALMLLVFLYISITDINTVSHNQENLVYEVKCISLYAKLLLSKIETKDVSNAFLHLKINVD